MLRYKKSNFEKRYFLLWHQNQVVASATMDVPLDQNRHWASVYLSVLPAYRRRHLGKRLMAQIAAYAQQKGCDQLVTNASSRLPVGETVLRHVGAHLTKQQQFIQLDLSQMEPTLLTNWIQECQNLDYHLWQHQGAYPIDRLAEIAYLRNIINTGLTDERAIHDWQATSESIQDEDDLLSKSEKQRLTTFLEHKSSRQLVGLTELYWDTQRASLLVQQATSVRTEHRGHSLGRWMKAANLQAILTLNSEAQYVRAGNTPDNIGMLRINQVLGFTSWMTHTDWQIDTSHLQTYLRLNDN
ncbi:GNAT family N-acetyltransferase [Spirosoma foliorum]|uniref:GNAT family N-acetyltransferase n=2 Tax=Spirosoma foliorum TaxID=2710596 RepID=A0A7G5H0Z8_9BACT|nr:GNAT family N-acetyltransferase [Spirosoma foliorum]